MLHLVGDGEESFGQFSATLYGLPGYYDPAGQALLDGQGELLCQPSSNSSASSSAASSGGAERARKWKCSRCQKDSRTANNLMMEKIQTYISLLQSAPNHSHSHWLRNPFLVSAHQFEAENTAICSDR